MGWRLSASVHRHVFCVAFSSHLSRCNLPALGDQSSKSLTPQEQIEGARHDMYIMCVNMAPRSKVDC